MINEKPPAGWKNIDLFWPGDPRALALAAAIAEQERYDAELLRQNARNYRGPAVTPIKSVRPKSKRKAPSRNGLKREVRGSCVVLSLRDPKAWRSKNWWGGLT